ncbi:FadR/GntR family transcriptional regulator [Pseudoxanthobacter sp.]|uniref:FadR/GntR family transcriptional regulator n=1 Tax=Pseudoxanthobacter sp. TaxID=1925742 RepID=UPI002FDFC29D
MTRMPGQDLSLPDTPAEADDEADGGTGAENGATGYRLRGLQGRLIRDIGESVVRGLYPPDTLLPRESELMERYSASRTSVREAIKVLAAKGLVETRQKIGTRVRARDQWNIFDADVLAWHDFNEDGDEVLKDLIEMRQIVEPPAARFAAGRATLDDIAAIGQAWEAMRAATGDPAAYTRADVSFHMAVFRASHNLLLKRFAHIVANFLQISFRIQQEALVGDEQLDDDVAVHREIFEAINRGDAAAAENAMMRTILDGKTHLHKARARFRERMRKGK